MVPRERPAPQDRARELAERFPEAREALEFCAALLAFDGDWPQLRALVMAKGAPALREAAAALEQPDPAALQDPGSPHSLFARVLLRRNPPKAADPPAARCPTCGQPPQCRCLYPEGHGSIFFLVCSLCATEWRFPRAQCPACGARAAVYSASRIPHVQTQVCEQCRRYLHIVDIGKDARSVPLLDEAAALAVDVWALDNGFRKIHPNLAGI